MDQGIGPDKQTCNLAEPQQIHRTKQVKRKHPFLKIYSEGYHNCIAEI